MLRRARAGDVVLLLSLLALGASLSLQKIRTFDYWWHLRTGALIAETGVVPKVDPYTFTVTGERWIDIHWLFQLGLHAVHRIGGHEAVVFGKVLLVVALMAILATIGWRRERPVVTAFGLGLMLLVACDRFMPRPELPSFVFLAAILALLDRDQRRADAAVFLVVPIQLLWVNVHGLFALGIGVCAMAFSAELLRPLVMPGEGFRPARLRRLALVTFLAALASLANPNLLDGALYPIQQLGMIGPPQDRGLFGSLIAELIPPLASGESLHPLVLALALLSFGAMALNWRRTSALDPLLWVAFAYLALGARRNIALFAVVAAPILVRNLNAFLDRRALPPVALRAATALVALALAILSVDVARDRFFPRIGSYREAGLGPFDLFYPVGAAEWIAREGPDGPVCHHMADGGYLIWRLFPRYQVMTDGRLEIFGEQRFLELQVGGSQRFRALDAEYHFGVVLVHYTLINSQELMWWLWVNSTWRLVFVDDVAALFVRRGDDGTSRWSELDVDAPDLFPPLQPELPRTSALMKRLARVNFYATFRRYARALALWEETLARYPDLDQGPIIRAYLLHRSGYPAAAEAILRELLETRPGDAVLHSQVGELRFEAGDAAAAKAQFDEAMRLDPQLSYAFLQRAMLAEAEGDADTAYLLLSKVVLTGRAADPVTLIAAHRLASLAARSGR